MNSNPKFMMAQSSDASWKTLVNACLEDIGTIPENYSLGFLYATDKLAVDLPKILAMLQSSAPHIDWVGTVGMGICTAGQEIYDRPSLALMIGDFPKDSYKILPGFTKIDDLSDEIQQWWQKQDFCLAFLHGDPASTETQSGLDQLAATLSNSFINGGIASSNAEHPRIANEIITKPLSGVLFNANVQVVTDHTQGCSLIGPPHEITKAQQNIAITLDHRPALDVLKDDIGEVLAKDLRKIDGYIFAALPITGTDTGDYLVRNLVGIDPEKGMVAIGDRLDDKQQLIFCRRDGNTAREDMLRMLERLKRRLGKQTIRGGIYISCLGRGRNQFGGNSEELKLIEEQLGNFPLVGFFANGEIYNGRLYGYTGVLTLFT